MTNGFDEMILNMTDTTPEPEDYTGSGVVAVIFSNTALISFFINSRPPCMSSLVCPF